MPEWLDLNFMVPLIATVVVVAVGICVVCVALSRRRSDDMRGGQKDVYCRLSVIRSRSGAQVFYSLFLIYHTFNLQHILFLFWDRSESVIRLKTQYDRHSTNTLVTLNQKFGMFLCLLIVSMLVIELHDIMSYMILTQAQSYTHRNTPIADHFHKNIPTKYWKYTKYNYLSITIYIYIMNIHICVHKFNT